MRQTAFALILSPFLALTLPAADQQLINMVMPDAKILAGINVDAVRNSPLGTFLMSQIASGAELQHFVAATGFNPQTDLQEILLATPGAPPATPADPQSPPPAAAGDIVAPAPHMRGLLLARGNFNVEKFSSLARTDGKQRIQTYHGALMISDPKELKASAVAFIGNYLAIVGNPVDVKAAVDRREQANSLDVELTTKVNALSSSQDMWAVSIAPLTSLNGGPATDPTLQGALNGDLFKKITQTSGGVKLGTQVQVSTELVASDEKNATALGDVVRFLASMVTMNAGAPKGPSAAVSLLQNLTVQTQGKVVNVTISAPEEQIEGLINSMKSQVPHPGATI